MSHLAGHPPEVLAQVLRQCEDIRLVLRLSSTCTRMRQVWLENTISIARAVFSFTRPELLDFLKLSRLEASTTLPTKLEEADINFEIRQHLSLIERSAFAVSYLGSKYTAEAERLAADRPRDEQPPPNAAQICGLWGRNDTYPDLVQAFLMIRRFAVGYNHQSTLPAVYATLQNLSYADLMRFYGVARILETHCEDCWEHIGIKKGAATEAYWALDSDGGFMSYVQDAWAFAVHIIEAEIWWRPTPWPVDVKVTEEEAHYQCANTCRAFGAERMQLMYGGREIPWTEERLAVKAAEGGS